MKDHLRSLFHAVLSLVGTICGVCLLLAGWWYAPNTVLAILDENLAIIKMMCGLLPESWGASAEIALRIGLGADKALLFAEGAWLCRLLIGGLGMAVFKRAS